MKRITVDYVMSLNPCYDREWVEGKFGGRKWMSPTSVLKLDISTENKLWLLLREDFLTSEQLVSFAQECAEHVKHFDNEWAARYARWAAMYARWAAREAAMYARWAARYARWVEGRWQERLLEKYLKEGHDTNDS